MNDDRDQDASPAQAGNVVGHSADPEQHLRARILVTWRKDLIHFNKTRDNHLGRLGTYHDVTVLVRRSARLGPHLDTSNTRIVHAPVDGLLQFYQWARTWAAAAHKKRPFDVVLVPVGEEPAGHLIWKKLQTARLAFDLWDVPGVLVLPRLSFKRLIAPLYRTVIRRAVRDADLVAVTGLRDAYDHLIPANTPCLELDNGVDTARYDTATADDSWWKHQTDRLRLVYVGIMSKYRGCIDLARAAAKAHCTGVPLELIMVGPGARSIRSRVHALVGDAPIQILDPIDSSKIPALLKSATIGCSPLWDIQKYRSSFPIKINEYLAAGIPILASDTPGHRIAVPEVCGRFFKPGDVESLSTTIATMNSDAGWRRDATEAAKIAAAGRDWELVVKSLAQGLGTLVHQKVTD